MYRRRNSGGARASRKAVATALAALGMTGGLIAGATGAEAALAPNAFPCTTSTIYIGQGTSTQLQELKYGDGAGSFTNVGSPVTPPYNAMGFNQIDHFIYAVNTSGHVVKVQKDGTVVDLGGVAVLTGGSAVNVGTFDLQNRYYAMRNNDTKLYRFTLPSLAPTTINLSAVPLAADLTPIGNSLWGEAPAGGKANLVRVNPTTGKVDFFPVAFLPAITGAGASWTYGNGNLGISDNVSGTVYQIQVANPDAAAPILSLVASSPGPSSNLNDGTSCVSGPSDLVLTKSGPGQILNGSQITYTLKVHNNGPNDSSGFTVTDTLPATITNVSSPSPGCTVAGQKVTCVGSELDAGQDAFYTVQGTVNDPTGGNVANSATVLGNETDPDPGSNTSTVVTDVALVSGLCRGTALRTTAIPVVGGFVFANANPAEKPCVAASQSVLNAAPPVVGLKASVLAAKTTKPANGATASASVESTSLLVGTTGIAIGAVQSNASAIVSPNCSTTLSGASSVASVTIGGVTQVVGSQPLTIAIPAVGTLYLNRKIVSGTTITQQAVFLDLTLTALPDITIAESKAGANCV